ncbi:MAG: hypothetical protein GC190_02755 [Alphaproteobacteria bacterium]|nr:hypothetical protein [Alphaproteobacteria bacterium]
MRDPKTSIATDVVAERDAELLAEYLRALQDCGISNRQILEGLSEQSPRPDSGREALVRAFCDPDERDRYCQ